MRNEWTEGQFRKKFEEVVKQASASGPQKITRKGKLIAVVVLSETWKEMNSKREGTKAKAAKRKRR